MLSLLGFEFDTSFWVVTVVILAFSYGGLRYALRRYPIPPGGSAKKKELQARLDERETKKRLNEKNRRQP